MIKGVLILLPCHYIFCHICIKRENYEVICLFSRIYWVPDEIAQCRGFCLDYSCFRQVLSAAKVLFIYLIMRKFGSYGYISMVPTILGIEYSILQTHFSLVQFVIAACIITISLLPIFLMFLCTDSIFLSLLCYSCHLVTCYYID